MNFSFYTAIGRDNLRIRFVCTVMVRNGYDIFRFIDVYISSHGWCPAISEHAIMSLWLGVELVTVPRDRSNV